MELQLSIDSSSNVIEILADYLTNSDHNVLTILLAIVSEKNIYYMEIWEEIGIKINGKSRGKNTKLLINPKLCCTVTDFVEHIGIKYIINQITCTSQTVPQFYESIEQPFLLLDPANFALCDRRLQGYAAYIRRVNEEVRRLRLEIEVLVDAVDLLKQKEIENSDLVIKWKLHTAQRRTVERKRDQDGNFINFKQRNKAVNQVVALPKQVADTPKKAVVLCARVCREVCSAECMQDKAKLAIANSVLRYLNMIDNIIAQCKNNSDVLRR